MYSSQKLYPKTRRVSDAKVIVTEKLDGSNLGFFNLGGELYIAQRDNIFPLQEVGEYKQKLYKGLLGFLEEHGEFLKNSLNNGSCIFGEWLGMRYPRLDKKFYMFAKANVSLDSSMYSISSLFYDHNLFKWSFINQELPSFIGKVPIVAELNYVPTIEELKVLYEDYADVCDPSTFNAYVEGLIVVYSNTVTKYLRMKNGNLEDHRS